MSGKGLEIDKTVAFITMGCAKNEVDSTHMAEDLQLAGYGIVDDASTADVVIVNTCSFIQAATEESIEAILDASELPRVRSGESHIMVAGCMPARYGDELASEFPEASDFVTCGDEGDIVRRVDSILGIERVGVSVVRANADERPLGTVSAYVKISDGCDRFCSYCTIPRIRGRYRSYEKETILDEVKKRVSEGVREIVLIAQDTGRWGDDLEQPSTLAALLDDLARSFPDIWFRVMYIQPEGVTDELLDVMAAHDNICSYLDIPFQHCESRLLELMNRKGSAGDFLSLIEHIRNRIEDVTLRTTLIAGFPGETEEEFEALLDFVAEASLDYVGVFPYSREDGTRAYNLDGQIDEDEKLYRAQRVRDMADDVSSSVIKGRIGSTLQILVCGEEEDGQLYGRAMCQAPDVDGVTYIDEAQIGDIVNVRVDDTLLYEMEGTVLP